MRILFSLVFGKAISSFGDGIHFVIINWFVYQKTKSIIDVGILQALTVLPSVFITPFIGHIVDSFDRRYILIIADIIRAIVLAIFVMTLTYSSKSIITFLYITTIILAIMRTLFNIAHFSLIAEVAEDKMLIKYNATISMFSQFGLILGASVGGVFLSMIGFKGGLLIDLITFLLSSIAIYFLRRGNFKPSKKSEGSFTSTMLAGYRYLANNKKVSLLLMISLSPISIIGWINILLPSFVKDILNLGSFEFGVLDAALGIGAIIGGLYIRLYEKSRKFIYRWYGFIMVGFFVLMLSYSKDLLSALLSNTLIGITYIGIIVYHTSEAQKIIPVDIIGRVTSFARLINNIIVPLNMMIISYFSNYLNSDELLLIVACICALLFIPSLILSKNN